MQNNIHKIFCWHQRHKKGIRIIAIAGAVVVAGLGIYCMMNSLEADELDMDSALSNSGSIGTVNEVVHGVINQNEVEIEYGKVNESDSQPKVISIKKHIRNLPDNWVHSTKKENEANELGISLETNQTIVDEHVRYIVAV